MNVKRLVIAGVAASVLFLVLDAALGMAGGLIGARVFGLPFEQPAGMEGKMMISPIFELINGFMLAAIYAVIHRSLPGRGWRKGLSYGLIVWGLRVVMWAFSTYMMTDMAPVLIAITVMTGLIEVLILGVVIAAIYKDVADVGRASVDVGRASADVGRASADVDPASARASTGI